MFEVVSTILYVAVVLIAILLICLVLVQPSKGGVFGAQAMSQLSKVTVVLLSLFFVLTLILAVMTGHRSRAAVSENSLVLKKEAAAKAAPAKPKAQTGLAPAPVKTLSKKPEAKPAPAASKPAAKPAPAAQKPAAPAKK